MRFGTHVEAVNAALRFQHGLAVEPWGEHPIRIRWNSRGTPWRSRPGGRPNVPLAVDVTARLMGLAMPGRC